MGDPELDEEIPIEDEELTAINALVVLDLLDLGAKRIH